ncbi:MAG: class I SAM-dependent methyltransferase [Saprospiraceae bacterium]|nr:class I SAM-dependent methyltransferase [Pyrinomonadaceae bacterium]
MADRNAQEQENPEESHDGYRWSEQNCPICEIKPTKYVGKRGGASHRENQGVETEIWACGKCGLIFPNPMPYPIGGLGQHYEVDADQYFQGHDKLGKLDNAAGLVEQAEKLLGRKGRLLDVGVGRGEILIAAKERGWDVEGVEPSESFADYAEKRIGVKIWRQPVEEAEIPEAEFDVVILAAVLEHLYNPDEIMLKISRILKPGGFLYLDVPNEKGLYFRVGNVYQKMRGRKWCVNLAPTFSPFHVFGFGAKSLIAILRKHGFEPKVWTVYGGTSMVSMRGGVFGKLESVASSLITRISNLGNMGTYIETWAVKK